MKIVVESTDNAIKEAAQSLIEGRLVAFPTETVYGLGADANNQTAVSRIYEVKNRPSNHPLIVHISSINQVYQWARNIPEEALNLANRYWPGPLTIVLQRSDLAKDFLTGNQEFVGLRIPSHTMALKLLEEFEKLGGNGVVAPSANKFGAVSPTTALDVIDEIGNDLGQNDLILDGGKCIIGIESTVVKFAKETIELIRPGAVTLSQIEKFTGKIVSMPQEKLGFRFPGTLNKHYSPVAKVFISNKAMAGDGFIALNEFETPQGAIRLASPNNPTEYAQQLYQALRLGDKKKLGRIFVVPPIIGEFSESIFDRIKKANGGLNLDV
jgi:L-threonylcarbamoyladenylate synthase